MALNCMVLILEAQCPHVMNWSLITWGAQRLSVPRSVWLSLSAAFPFPQGSDPLGLCLSWLGIGKPWRKHLLADWSWIILWSNQFPWNRGGGGIPALHIFLYRKAAVCSVVKTSRTCQWPQLLRSTACNITGAAVAGGMLGRDAVTRGALLSRSMCR